MSFYMGNCAQYFVYALLLAAAGLIVQKREPAEVEEMANTTTPPKIINESDNELDEWFGETNADNKAESLNVR